MAERILVVDDEETLCEALRFNLEAEGYEVDVALSAEEALSLDLDGYSLILLDIMMGEISGTQMARIIRSNPLTASVPIIFCTALSSEDDMVDALDLGGDDYITKPYSLRNVIARVRSVLRRSATDRKSAPAAHSAASSCIVSDSTGGLTLDPTAKRCSVDGTEIRLPRKEFEILYTLMSHPGQVFSREDLLKAVWPGEVVVLDRVIDVNITRIRHKIGRYGKNIVTRSGYGYAYME